MQKMASLSANKLFNMFTNWSFRSNPLPFNLFWFISLRFFADYALFWFTSLRFFAGYVLSGVICLYWSTKSQCPTLEFKYETSHLRRHNYAARPQDLWHIYTFIYLHVYIFMKLWVKSLVFRDLCWRPAINPVWDLVNACCHAKKTQRSTLSYPPQN